MDVDGKATISKPSAAFSAIDAPPGLPSVSTSTIAPGRDGRANIQPKIPPPPLRFAPRFAPFERYEPGDFHRPVGVENLPRAHIGGEVPKTKSNDGNTLEIETRVQPSLLSPIRLRCAVGHARAFILRPSVIMLPVPS
mmetsp:Transcript_11725/g.22188  ORF Transcript_11725/g.22188 Transcript_11725/m.22188 type:complete len:138 (+) Transcript_11725:1756-2169(+)